MKQQFFLADVHLSYESTPSEKRKQQKLADFFDLVKKNGDTLYIVGDFFDFWFEWHHVIQKYWFGVLIKLKELTAAGVRVVFITGNHDFYCGSFLSNELGLECVHEQTEFTAANKRFFVAHGDGLSKKDYGYRLLKRIIRHPLSIFLFKNFIHPDLGVKLAKWALIPGKKKKYQDKSKWLPHYLEFAETKSREGYDYIILGHLHYPCSKQLHQSLFVCCGECNDQLSYACFDGQNLELKTF